MITGFNTDIEFEGVTYHVQTEDKGRSRPIILSLVYDRGTILASKRLPYDDLLVDEFDEKLLTERLQKQHRLICAAVQAGRIEELKQMTARSADAAKKNLDSNFEVAATASNRKSVSSQNSLVVSVENNLYNLESPIPRPFFETGNESFFDVADESMIDGVSIIGDELGEIILPEEAVEVLGNLDGSARPTNNKLSIEILGETNFKGGERRTLGFMVCRGSERKVVGDAQIMVKIIGSSFRPLIFHASTDSNGLATVNFQLPSFTTGRAAFLVRAMNDGEEVEMRRSIAHG
ncbi:MAG: hypothetical protein H7070_05080 [Saprospiraceae bacterium]|nr:hypothetical protein [Pyrinomonadaceae bacterium]